MNPNDVKRWAQAYASPEERQHARMTGLLPGSNDGTYVVPFKRGDRNAYLNRIKGTGVFKRAESVEPSPVRLSELTSAQRSVNAERLKQHLENPELVPKGKRAPGHGGIVDAPVVVKVDGVMWLHDGNHRATAAVLRGQDTIDARVVDLDKPSPVSSPM